MNRRQAFQLFARKSAALIAWFGMPPADALSRQAGDPPDPRPWDIAAQPRLDISHLEIEPGAEFAHIKLTLDKDPPMTVRFFCTVATDGARGFAPELFRRPLPYCATWSPGDELVQYISIPIHDRNSEPGWRLKISSTSGMKSSGFVRADAGLDFNVNVVENPAQPNRLPERLPVQRPPFRLDLGRPQFDQNMATISWTRTGRTSRGASCWRSSLLYGDGPNNPVEKGLYANSQTYPGTNAHLKEIDGAGRPYVRLHTRKFQHPVQQVDGTGQPTRSAWPFQASWLSAQTIDELCHESGVWELDYVSPDRYGAWAAHWFMGVTKPGDVTVWPPEIDVFEHFNGVYGAWDAAKWTSSTLHFGDFGKGRRGSIGATVPLPAVGFDPAIDLTKEIHKSQVHVGRDFITIFFDGVEVLQFRHILKPIKPGDTKLFHPVVNVAVAPSSNEDPYNQGSGDMLMYGYRYYSPEAVKLVAHTDAKPWRNRQITPGPKTAPG